MPRPRFAKLPASKRHRILEAAALEFAELGYSGASLNRIIDAAGISKGATYYYFDDKADLFAAVVQHGCQAFEPDEPRDLATLERDTFWPTLRSLYDGMLEQARRQPWLVAVGKLIYGRPPSEELSAMMADEFGRVRELLADLIGRGQSLGVVRADVPAELLVTVLMAVLEAADRWVVEHPQTLEAGASDPIGALFGMLRRLVEPQEVSA